MEAGLKDKINLKKINWVKKVKIADNKNVGGAVVSDAECFWAGEGSDLWWAEGEKCDFCEVIFGL
jgi:hypothetical protein